MSKRFDRNTGAKLRPDLSIKLTIIDRLRKTDPVVSSSAQKRGPLGPLWESICLNLDWVLNSRLALNKPDEMYGELAKSMYVYGVRDLAGSRFDSPREYSRLRTEITELITLFEPRLTEVSVDKPDRPRVGTLRFRINALVLVDPEPERASFNIEADSGSGEYDVEAVD